MAGFGRMLRWADEGVRPSKNNGVTKIGKHFGWQNQFTDLYAHPVPAGKHQNDVIFSTGINFSFAN